MSLVARDGSYSQPQPIGAPVFEFPFDAMGADGALITQRYKQEKAAFIADMIAGTYRAGRQTHPAYPTAQVCDTDKPSDTTTGLYEFTRTWAIVPTTPAYDAEDYAFPYPALASTLTGSAGNVTALSYGAAATRPVDLTITSNVTGVSQGDWIYVNIHYTYTSSAWPGSVLGYTIFGFFKVKAKSGSDYTISTYNYTDNISAIQSGAIYKGIPGRTFPKNMVVASLLASTFIVTDDPTGITLPQRFLPITVTTGEEATSLNDTDTSPTATQYIAMMQSQASLPIEAKLKRWRGNIWQLTTRTVPAL